MTISGILVVLLFVMVWALMNDNDHPTPPS